MQLWAMTQVVEADWLLWVLEWWRHWYTTTTTPTCKNLTAWYSLKGLFIKCSLYVYTFHRAGKEGKVDNDDTLYKEEDCYGKEVRRPATE